MKKHIYADSMKNTIIKDKQRYLSNFFYLCKYLNTKIFTILFLLYK